MSVATDQARPTGRYVLGVLVAILVLATFGGYFLSAALALSAVTVAFIMLRRPPRTLPWRLATVAATLWAVEEIVWFAQRLSDPTTTPLITEVTYYLGLATWFAAMLLMPRKRLPRSLVLALIPAVGLLVWLLFLDPPATITLAFPVLETLLVITTLPLLGGAMAGGASEGRVLVVLGFYLRALGAGSLAWLTGTEAGSATMVLWLMSYVMLALGLLIEFDDMHVEFLPVAVAVTSLQVVSSGLLLVLYRARIAFDPYVLVIVALLGYIQVAVVILALVTSRAAQRVVDGELRAWQRAFDAITEVPEDATALVTMLRDTVARVPHGRGIEVHGTASAGTTDGYAYPLVAGGAEIGRIYFSRRPARTSVLDTCAPMLATRLHLMSDRDRWAAAARTDPLTNLLNRRGLELRAGLLVGQAHVTAAALSVAMLDIDHFKRVNDVYGHAVGDEVLKTLAAIFTQHLRPGDQAVRWGGEEFVVVLPAADAEQAVEVMRRVRHAVSQTVLAPVEWPLAVSVGIAGAATVENSPDVLKRLIDAADAALGLAKRGGRNRIVRTGAPLD